VPHLSWEGGHHANSRARSASLHLSLFAVPACHSPAVFLYFHGACATAITCCAPRIPHATTLPHRSLIVCRRARCWRHLCSRIARLTPPASSLFMKLAKRALARLFARCLRGRTNYPSRAKLSDKTNAGNHKISWVATWKTTAGMAESLHIYGWLDAARRRSLPCHAALPPACLQQHLTWFYRACAARVRTRTALFPTPRCAAHASPHYTAQTRVSRTRADARRARSRALPRGLPLPKRAAHSRARLPHIPAYNSAEALP